VSGEPMLFSSDQLRPSQREVIVGYPGGKMGISAVPGSGKTHTLSYLAADIILAGNLEVNQEVLIVTLTNSAVENFTRRIGGLVKSEGLLPGLGYRVRTLHGLAHDIVREHPALLNLANDFSILDESEATTILQSAVQAWLRANPGFIDDYLSPDLEEYKKPSIARDYMPRLLQGIAANIIRVAKDRELSPAGLESLVKSLPAPLPLLQMSTSIYQEYQRSLSYRGAVDFDDLIRLALAALRLDPRLLERLRQQWPYILEDEAQDSSRLQEQILSLLAGREGNWVRVGDPNQAIYETFTTADPRYLRDFIAQKGVLNKELPVSGRSTRSIIDLANHLIDWTMNEHPLPEARNALRLPYIRETSPGDRQANPPVESGQITFDMTKYTPAEEIDRVCVHLKNWQANQDRLPEEERETLVVLDLQNDRLVAIATRLREQNLDPVEFLNTTASTRLAAGALANILRYLADPQSARLLAKAFEVWRRVERKNEPANALNRRVA